MNDFRLWECLVCGFIYDEARGWPDEGIEPGTRWEDIPEDWVCPDCGVGKADFDMVDTGPSSNAASSNKNEKPELHTPVHSPLKPFSESPKAAPSAKTVNQQQQWQCRECDFIYSETQGWLEDKLAAGTPWPQIATDWQCPDCGAEKSAFMPVFRSTARGQVSIESAAVGMESQSKRIVIIGTGLAAYNLVKAFRKQDQATPILMLSRDDGHFYFKPQISAGYTRNKRADELVTAPAEKMAADLNVAIRVFTEVTKINTHAQTVEANGQPLGYAKLVLAWGASCIAPPLQGSGLSEVYQVNDLFDYSRFRTALVGKKKVLVIGAGLIGSEYANDLANGGFDLTAVDPLNGPLATLLPEAASQAVQRGLESLGVQYHFATVVQRIDQYGNGVRATLENGESVDSDIVLSAVGVRPRLQLAKDAGIETNRGIVVNRLLETSANNVYALGDCAEVAGQVLYYLLPLMACAKSLAETLAGNPTEVAYGAMPVSVKTPVCPLNVLPPPLGVEGDWKVEQKNNDTRALFYDRENTLRGFALTGAHSSESMKLAAQIPALMA